MSCSTRLDETCFPYENEHGLTILEFSVIKIAAGLASNPNIVQKCDDGVGFECNPEEIAEAAEAIVYEIFKQIK